MAQSNSDLQADYKLVFETEEGKRVLEDLRAKSGFDSATMLFSDDRKQAYMAGSGGIFRYILDKLEPKKERINNNGSQSNPDSADEYGY